ncbi:hypothetical protein KDW83_29865, partial [Burkholderia multivorans]
MKSDEQSGTDSSAGLSRDTANANQTVQNTFNLQKVQNDMVNHTGDRGGCLVKVKQVPQSALQVADSIALRPQRAECRRWIR